MKVDGIMSGIQNYYEPISSVKESNASDKEKIYSAQEETDKKDKVEAEKVASEVYGDVLSKSADGDVTTAAKQSLNALSDGLVMPKDNTPEITTTLKQPVETKNKIEQQAQDKADEEEIDSLTGYTSNELETLYAKGAISKYDYDQEISRRAELTQEDKRTAEAEKPKVEEKKDTTDQDDEKESARIQQVIEGNNTFTKNMAQINETAANDDLKTQTLNTAKENGRLDIMNQILGNN